MPGSWMAYIQSDPLLAALQPEAQMAIIRLFETRMKESPYVSASLMVDILRQQDEKVESLEKRNRELSIQLKKASGRGAASCEEY